VDEICGMAVTLFALPFTPVFIIGGFALFRVFDILKPFPIRWVEIKVPGGLGIMLDDILAGTIGQRPAAIGDCYFCLTINFLEKQERPATILKKREETDAAPKKKGALRENIEAIVVAVILALFIRTFVVQAFKIPSGSMKDTLLIGDHILVNKFIYGVKAPFLRKTIVPINDPQREDIIVFEFPEDPSKDFIKRVVGIPGDIVEIRNKKLFVTDHPLPTVMASLRIRKYMPRGRNPGIIWDRSPYRMASSL
jgi:signal peptidase I